MIRKGNPRIDKNNTSTLMGFTGILLGILVNTVSTIRPDEYSKHILDTLNISFIVTAFCLSMSILLAFTANLNKHEDLHEKLILHSQMWLSAGLGASILGILPAMIFKTNQKAITYTFIGFIIALLIIGILEHKSIYSKKSSIGPGRAGPPQ
jgi:amino acid transporter